jgi:bifunctional non-homologous end joining protein LigD
MVRQLPRAILRIVPLQEHRRYHMVSTSSKHRRTTPPSTSRVPAKPRRRKAAPIRAGRDPQPAWVEPMKALLVAEIPHEQESRWVYEIKWAIAFHDGKSFKLYSRNHLDATFRYPEIAELGAALGNRTAILDGEIIALDADGNPSFPLLQKRMNVTRPAAVDRAAREIEVSYILFDLLYLDGRDLRGEPWQVRREQLETLAPLLPPACRISPVRLGSEHRGRGGEEMLEIARQKMLEGVVAKKVDSRYEAGERSGSWIKVKLVQRQELVVGGWVPEVSKDGTVRRDQIGAILVGYYEPGGKKFHFAGAVGTGFDAAASRAMVERLKSLSVHQRPFEEQPLARGGGIRKFRAPVQWVKPAVVVEVEYRRWPAGGLMHQAAFKGVRTDKPAREVVRETAG